MCILKTGVGREGALRVLGLKVSSFLCHFKWDWNFPVSRILLRPP